MAGSEVISSMTVWTNLHLLQHRGGQHERVEIVFSHRSVHHVQRPRQRQPHVDDRVKSAGAQHSSLECRGRRSETERGRGVQGVADVQVVGEGLRPVLGGVHGGVGGDEVLLPVRWRALVVVTVQRCLVVGIRVAEQLTEPLAVLLRRTDEPVVVIVTDLVPEMAEQRPVRLVHRDSAAARGVRRRPRRDPV